MMDVVISQNVGDFKLDIWVNVLIPIHVHINCTSISWQFDDFQENTTWPPISL